MGIRLSEQHGVNPSVEKCFYCMKDIGVVLFGKMKGDKKAPEHVVTSTEPCDECKELMERGIILISVDEEKTEDFDNPWRSGGWCVVKEDFLRRVIEPGEHLDATIEKRFAFVPDDAWDLLGLPRGAM